MIIIHLKCQKILCRFLLDPRLLVLAVPTMETMTWATTGTGKVE
jgi:hypothetical protein